MALGYTEVMNIMGGPPDCVRRDDGVFIPFDDDNVDYQAYKAWLAEGNRPASAPERPAQTPAGVTSR